jgi:hypothetical protein
VKRTTATETVFMENVTQLKRKTTSAGTIAHRGVPSLPHAEDLARYGERLQSALLDVLQALPVHIRSPRKLYDALGVDRSTCYRLWRASQVSPNRWDEIARSLPGTAAMRGFAAAIKHRRLAPEQVDRFELAVEQFDSFVHEKYRSQTRLKDLLSQVPAVEAASAQPEAELPSTASTSTAAIKAAAFENALAVNRSLVDLNGAIVLVMPSQEPGHIVEVAMLLAYLGYQASPGGRPLIVHVGSQKEQPLAPRRSDDPNSGLEIRDAAGGPIAGRSDHCIVPEFSSHPLPAVLREHSASRQLARLCVDPADVQQLRAGFDIVVAFRLDPIPHSPEQALAPFKAFIKTIDHPTRNLIVDVYLHRSFAKSCIPEAVCQAPVPAWMHESEMARWAYRIAEYPDLRILPNEIAAAEDRAWPRYAEMCRFFFDRCGANRGDYAGHRMSTTFPIWPTSYMLAFRYD